MYEDQFSWGICIIILVNSNPAEKEAEINMMLVITELQFYDWVSKEQNNYSASYTVCRLDLVISTV